MPFGTSPTAPVSRPVRADASAALKATYDNLAAEAAKAVRDGDEKAYLRFKQQKQSAFVAYKNSLKPAEEKEKEQRRKRTV